MLWRNIASSGEPPYRSSHRFCAGGRRPISTRTTSGRPQENHLRARLNARASILRRLALWVFLRHCCSQNSHVAGTMVQERGQFMRVVNHPVAGKHSSQDMECEKPELIHGSEAHRIPSSLIAGSLCDARSVPPRGISMSAKRCRSRSKNALQFREACPDRMDCHATAILPDGLTPEGDRRGCPAPPSVDSRSSSTWIAPCPDLPAGRKYRCPIASASLGRSHNPALARTPSAPGGTAALCTAESAASRISM